VYFSNVFKKNLITTKSIAFPERILVRMTDDRRVGVFVGHEFVF